MIRRSTLLLFNIVLLVMTRGNPVFGQSNAPILEWERNYGGSKDDEIRGLELTGDGGFITVGVTWSNDGDITSGFGNADYWIVKYDSVGNITWQVVAGGNGSDWGRGISKTSDGGYLIAGYTQSTDGHVNGNHGDYDQWILKLNSNGDIVWKKCFGGSAFDNAYRAIETSDGNYLVVGFTESDDGQVTGFHGAQDFWILKVDPSGAIIWSKAMGGSGKEQAACVIETSDGNYLVTGYAESADGDVTDHKGGKDLWTVKLTPQGSLLWKKSYGGGKDDGARWVVESSDGGYVFCGFSGSNNIDCTVNQGSYDYWVMKTDANGILLWQKSLGGQLYDYSYFITTDLDGNFLITGYAFSAKGDITNSHGGSEYWLVKVDTLGNMMWQKAFGGSVFDECRSVMVKSNGNYLLAGFSYSDDGDVTSNYGGSDAWIVEACSSPLTFYTDADNDGYGDPANPATGCILPGGYSLNNLDCNDANPQLHPGVLEFCNGIDDDCSGIADDNLSLPVITASGSTTFCFGGSVILSATNFSPLASYQWYQSGLPVAGATSITFTATAGASYFFTASWQSCYSASNTIVVTVNPLPTASITNGTTIYSCKGDDVKLHAALSGGCEYQWSKNGSPIAGATGSSYTYKSNSNANFTVTVTSSKGCTATSTATSVNKLPKPDATITPQGNLNICITGQVALQAGSGIGYTYRWYRNNVKITGATNQTYTATLIGNYTVKVTDANGCSKTSSAITVYTSCRLTPQNPQMQISVSPNPAGRNFSLTIFSDLRNASADIALLDLTGKTVLQQTLLLIEEETTQIFEIPSKAANGIYFLLVKTGSGSRVLKLTIEK